MDASNAITAAVFSAFVKCPTKAHLVATDEPTPGSFFAEIEASISSMYKVAARRSLPIGAMAAEFLDFEQLHRNPHSETITHYVDCDTAVYDLASSSHRPKGPKSQKPSLSGAFVPVLLLPWDKVGLSDSLIVCFGALALSQVTGQLADSGTLIYGDSHRRRIVRIGEHVAKVRQIIDAIGDTCRDRKPPPLVLNGHCTVCDFQSRCRGVAIESDDLSLLTAMTVKERAKCYAKGVFTITQLSYGYRPRRRKRTRADALGAIAKRTGPIARNDHKLKALAIKKNQIHVVRIPSPKYEGVPVFLDVEGMPDRDFYYLVGLWYRCGEELAERTFWADELADKRLLWENCLRTLRTIGDAQIVSFGAYETRFLRKMRERYIRAPNDVEFVDRLIETSINLLGSIYGNIYFPTYSNGLKEVGRYLGFEWTWPMGSGAAAPLLRRSWELGADDGLKRQLISYNMDDCRAAATVADALVRICDGGTSSLDAVDVGSLEVGFQRTFGKFDSVLPEFTRINGAAYWDYQRSKVYARTDKSIRRSVRKAQGGKKSVTVEREVTVGDAPQTCPRCRATRIWVHESASQVVCDLKFTRKGVKRWVVRYRYKAYRCGECHARMAFYSRRPRYGQSLQAFIIYLLIELRLSNQKAIEHLSLLFDLPLDKRGVRRIKSAMAEKYMPTYQGILRQIAKGTLIHADETKGVVRGGGHYVWVFANMTTVAYVYAETREAAILEELLDGFSGVLVSDFYAAYDSAPCAQQKCLIHLMRDINEDLHKNPFDDELADIAGRFGALLREIVGTIDVYGLKARHLGKHRRSAERFIEHVVSMKCATEAGLALRKRIEKNSNKLFTFLNYDGVPWNNNNAEHAVRAFTRLWNEIGSSTPKGTREYATLLSIQQTLRWRGMGFLEFLRSSRMEIDG